MREEGREEGVGGTGGRDGCLCHFSTKGAIGCPLEYTLNRVSYRGGGALGYPPPRSSFPPPR